MQVSDIKVTKEQLVNFILKDVNDEECQMIMEAIKTNPEIKESYLFEKRINDVGRYINDEMMIGEACEIEELMKLDSRLYDYFESNTEAIEEEFNEEEQDVYISDGHMCIIKEQLVDFILSEYNEEYISKYERISKLINKNPAIKEIYLFEKRKYDIERYLNNEMDFGERCEIEELIKINSRLYAHFKLNKGVNEFLETALKDQLNNIHEEIYDASHNDEADRIDDEPSPAVTAPVIKLKHNILRIGKWVAAASIILMVSTYGIRYYTSNLNTVEERLYIKYYEPFRTDANNFFSNSTLIEAKNKYNNNEYGVAWLLIENLPGSLTIEAEKTLYAGLALMELERFEVAIDKFEFLHANENQTVIHSISKWYLALCYLNTEKRAEAIESFEDIVANKTYNYSNAKKILRKLN